MLILQLVLPRLQHLFLSSEKDHKFIPLDLLKKEHENQRKNESDDLNSDTGGMVIQGIEVEGGQ